MHLSDALEMGYLDAMDGIEDARDEVRYVPHMRPTGAGGGCGTPTSPERPCGYCGGDGGAWY